MAARVQTDSQPDKPIAGKVGYISSVAEFTPKAVQTEELRTSLVYECACGSTTRKMRCAWGSRPRCAWPRTPRNERGQRHGGRRAPAQDLRSARRRPAACGRRRVAAHKAGRADRAGRPGRRRQDHAAAHAGRAAQAGRRRAAGAGHRRDARPAGGAGPHQLHAAALRPVRGSERAGEPGLVRRPARRAAGGAPRTLCPPAGDDRPGALQRPPGRQAVRRHETEAGAGLHAGALAGPAAAGRAQRGRRSAVAARPVEDRAAADRRREPERDRQHRLHGRGQALRPGLRHAPGPPAGRRRAGPPDGARAA